MKVDPDTGAVKSGITPTGSKVELDAMEKAEVLRDYFEGRAPQEAARWVIKKVEPLMPLPARTRSTTPICWTVCKTT